ncbi:MAG: hypothetical protein JWM74_1597 [Myxococcaceae bacterium]|nr:hypothetical protein [Myxococcaceae bacterium]
MRISLDELKLLGRAIESDEGRLEYETWLTNRGDPRAEILRVERELLAASGRSDPEVAGLRACMRLLLAKVDIDWWDHVSAHARLRNCGLASHQPPRIRFSFRCPNAWESLAPTSNPAVRHCGECAREVFACASPKEAADRARAGECIAVEQKVAAVARAEVTRYVTGRPDVDQDWADAIFGRNDDE